ncbi:uncharacterized protein PADG_02045 [Paracoccidioides brasiliensis Pb18]|uniref:Uncharacterized protein n=1 Tax=Paracoccidioides brasiliensis (strain Pb18) TaxID=502780 RepID=C1G529_PARBD|nr:uncharacterized protein PADG_02045 [Paracoccidioides brasiliensis Pb18]EEH45895.2 hypothetical protein PADG_02045 [Paracoccidioides brasiliensis Pb18]
MSAVGGRGSGVGGRGSGVMLVSQKAQQTTSQRPAADSALTLGLDLDLRTGLGLAWSRVWVDAGGSSGSSDSSLTGAAKKMFAIRRGQGLSPEFPSPASQREQQSPRKGCEMFNESGWTDGDFVDFQHQAVQTLQGIDMIRPGEIGWVTNKAWSIKASVQLAANNEAREAREAEGDRLKRG